MLFNEKLREDYTPEPAKAEAVKPDPVVAANRPDGMATRPVIDPWLRVTGNLEGETELQIDGHIRGDIRCTKLVISKGATVDGNVTADEVIIRAKVIGVVRGKGQRPLGGLPKRVLDITVASIALVLLLPIMLIVTALIRIFMGGPAIFAQQRIGLGGRVFRCYKFRTMVTNGEEVLRRHLDADPEAAREWKETRKLANDPRVGCLGNILRKSSIDELPQLFNVLRGDMSLVGPRPIVPEELEYYGRHVRAYLKARPGLTGVWQISGRNRLSYAARVAKDRHYVRHWSLAVDLAVLIKTIPAILKFSETA